MNDDYLLMQQEIRRLHKVCELYREERNYLIKAIKVVIDNIPDDRKLFTNEQQDGFKALEYILKEYEDEISNDDVLLFLSNDQAKKVKRSLDLYYENGILRSNSLRKQLGEEVFQKAMEHLNSFAVISDKIKVSDKL